MQAHGVEWEEFVPEDEAWALSLQVFLGDPPGSFVQMFELVICSKEWLGSAGWREPGGFWFNMFGTGYTVPWPCVVLDEYSPERLRLAIEDIVARCYADALAHVESLPDGTGLLDWFMHSMRRFAQWDGEPVPGRNR